MKKNEKEAINIKYSIDKVKLEFQYIRTERIQEFLNVLTYADYSSQYSSNATVKCKHNFTFENQKGSKIYVGIVPNWKREDKYDKSIVLEYNPNKIDPFLFEELEWLKNINPAVIKIMSMDFAVDYEIAYKKFCMLKRDKRESFAIFGHGEVETRYLGSEGHNHVKLYNKAVEQKLKDINWTRFEITCKKINSLFCDFKEFTCLNIPTMYLCDNQIDFSYQQLNDITKIVFESIVKDVNVLYSIRKYDTRKKYEKMLSQFLQPVDIDVKLMYDVYLQFCNVFKSDLNTTDCLDSQQMINEMMNEKYPF